MPITSAGTGRSLIVHGIDPTRVGAAVFDLGGVFLAGSLESVASFGTRHGIPQDAWAAIRRELFVDDGLWAAVERGERPLDDFAARLRNLIAEHGGNVSVGQARDFMNHAGENAKDYLRQEIVDAAARIHDRLPTALLTNNIPEWRHVWRSLLDTDALFDVIVDSCEVGTRKPEPAIYELTRQRLGVPHEAIFFVDDLGVNLKTARGLGWQTLRYDDTTKVLEVLHAIAAAKPLRRAG